MYKDKYICAIQRAINIVLVLYAKWLWPRLLVKSTGMSYQYHSEHCSSTNTQTASMLQPYYPRSVVQGEFCRPDIPSFPAQRVSHCQYSMLVHTVDSQCVSYQPEDRKINDRKVTEECTWSSAFVGYCRYGYWGYYPFQAKSFSRLQARLCQSQGPAE